jgi:hypothetical protein
MASSDTVAFLSSYTFPGQKDLVVCPISGCPADPVSLVSRDNRTAVISPIGIVGTNAYWALRNPFEGYVTDIARGPLAGGSALTINTYSNTGGWGGGLAVDSTSVYYIDNDTFNILSCPNGATCSSPTTVKSGGDSPVTLRIYGGKLYWSTYTGINRCTPSSCSNPERLVTMSGGISELAVDANGFYWVAPSDGTLYSCPLTGCVGGGSKVGVAGTGVGNLRVGGEFIYWTNSGAIYRLRKL